MKILVSSHAFSPAIGGIESVSLAAAKEFQRLEHEVKVVTQTESGDPGDDHGLVVLRKPSPSVLLSAVRWCDVFWHNNLRVRVLWPAIVAGKPLVVTHQGSYCLKPSGFDLAQRFKHAIVHRCASIAISEYVAGCFAVRSVVIPNPYDEATFYASAPDSGERPGDLVFAGRLVTEKGVDILLQSLFLLREKNCHPRLTIVGLGPEKARLERITADLGLQQQVSFVGPLRGAQLANIFRAHKILVVPSRYKEPFGVVALEGIASGCAVIASNGGGLPDAVGPCGLTFPNEDTYSLAGAIECLLSDPARISGMRSRSSEHLQRFRTASVAQSYLQVFQSAIASER